MDAVEQASLVSITGEKADFPSHFTSSLKTKRPREYFHLWAESSVYAGERFFGKRKSWP
jgi:hypothetical protein